MKPVQYVDTNNIVFLDAEQSVAGQLDAITAEGDALTLSATLSADPGADDVLLLVDQYRRFVGAAAASRECQLKLPATAFNPLSPDGFALYLYRPGMNRAFPVGISQSQQEEIRDAVRSHIADAQVVEIPSFIERYTQMIIDATSESYVSTSNVDGIRTGNNYQTIDFGKILRQGGRPQRDLLLQRIRFAGKSVLDIGANTGEMSRIVRRFGADLVDGVEYDRFFVETGRMINAVTGMTRVSLFQGDASNRGLYDGKSYDIVMALAVYVYTRALTDKLAEITDVMIVETHTLDHGLDMYIDNARPHFPVVKLLGYPDMQPNVDRSRALLVCTKTREQLDEVLDLPELRVAPYFDNRFFANYQPVAVDQFDSFLESLETVREKIEQLADFKFGSSEYFEAMLLGYADYRAAGEVNEDNLFVRRYLDSIRTGEIDTALQYMLDKPELACAKVRKKYQDLDAILANDLDRVPPILLTEDPDGHLTFEDVSGETLKCSNIDGHHRVFMYQLLSLPTMEYIYRRDHSSFQSVIKHNYSL